jgi:hypothetical protein
VVGKAIGMLFGNATNATILHAGPSTPESQENELQKPGLSPFHPEVPSLYEWQMRLVGKTSKE